MDGPSFVQMDATKAGAETEGKMTGMEPTGKPPRQTSKERAQRARDNLTDGYVAGLLARSASVRAADIQKPLIDAKRAHLQLVRLMKEKEKTS
jgi:hypothetical protein